MVIGYISSTDDDENTFVVNDIWLTALKDDDWFNIFLFDEYNWNSV